MGNFPEIRQTKIEIQSKSALQNLAAIAVANASLSQSPYIFAGRRQSRYNPRTDDVGLFRSRSSRKGGFKGGTAACSSCQVEGHRGSFRAQSLRQHRQSQFHGSLSCPKASAIAIKDFFGQFLPMPGRNSKEQTTFDKWVSATFCGFMRLSAKICASEIL